MLRIRIRALVLGIRIRTYWFFFLEMFRYKKDLVLERVRRKITDCGNFSVWGNNKQQCHHFNLNKDKLSIRPKWLTNQANIKIYWKSDRQKEKFVFTQSKFYNLCFRWYKENKNIVSEWIYEWVCEWLRDKQVYREL